MGGETGREVSIARRSVGGVVSGRVVEDWARGGVLGDVVPVFVLLMEAAGGESVV